MRIIPAIDIIEGQCVRLSQGDYKAKTIYNSNPLEVAKSFEANGIQYLHLVDLDGAKAKEIRNLKVLELIATATNLEVDFGGGIKTTDSAKSAFDAGAAKINCGSIAVNNPELVEEWLATFGSKRIILSADCKNSMIATSGWLESTNLNVVEFIGAYLAKGISQVVTTDIAKDGMLQGPSFDLYKEILHQHDVELIASGGVSKISDLEQLQAIGCSGVVIGKAIYEGRISLKELAALC